VPAAQHPQGLGRQADGDLRGVTSPYVLNGRLRIDDYDGIAVGASGCTTVGSNTVDCGPATGYMRVIFSFGPGDDVMLAPYFLIGSRSGGRHVISLCAGGAARPTAHRGKG
jgi:hypothetical protein